MAGKNSLHSIVVTSVKRNLADYLKQPGFLDLGFLSLMNLISGNAFVPEEIICDAVLTWVASFGKEHEQRKSYFFRLLLSRVNLQLLSEEYLITKLLPMVGCQHFDLISDVLLYHSLDARGKLEHLSIRQSILLATLYRDQSLAFWDFGAKVWIPGPSLPEDAWLGEIWCPEMVSAGGKLYVVSCSKLFIFDLEKFQWSRGPDLPENCCGAAVAGSNSEIVVIGGVFGSENVYSFSFRENEWTKMVPFGTRRSYGSAAFDPDSGDLFVVGGVTAFEPLNVSIRKMKGKGGSQEWHKISPEIPVLMNWSPAIAFHRNELYVFDGTGIWILGENGQWDYANFMPAFEQNPAALEWHNLLWVVERRVEMEPEGPFLGMQVFDPETRTMANYDEEHYGFAFRSTAVMGVALVDMPDE